MPSDQGFMDYVCEQCAAAGTMTYRKMFGEYALYCDAQVVALVCDNQLFIKETEAGRALLPQVTMGAPFSGARPWLLADEYLDDAHLIARVVRATAMALAQAVVAKNRSSPVKRRAKAKPTQTAVLKTKTKTKTKTNASTKRKTTVRAMQRRT